MMTIDIKNIEKLIKLCRKHGISEMDIQGVKLKLGPNLNPPRKSTKKTNAPELALTSDYTDEELAFWSSQGA